MYFRLRSQVPVSSSHNKSKPNKCRRWWEFVRHWNINDLRMDYHFHLNFISFCFFLYECISILTGIWFWMHQHQNWYIHYEHTKLTNNSIFWQRKSVESLQQNAIPSNRNFECSLRWCYIVQNLLTTPSCNGLFSLYFLFKSKLYIKY